LAHIECQDMIHILVFKDTLLWINNELSLF